MCATICPAWAGRRRSRATPGSPSSASTSTWRQLFEIWQADAEGRYAHPADPRGTNQKFRGFGRFGTGTDPQNRFIFHTVKPGAVDYLQKPADADDDPYDVKQLMSFEREDAAVRKQRSTQSIEDDSYAHVLVDEAQDLSPMQWRMLGRRGKYASWTIVGDAAQSSWPYPDEAAQARTAALDGKEEHHFRLSTNYRNSAEIYDLAAQVARVAIPGADTPDAVRRTGEEPRHEVVAAAQVWSAVRNGVRDLAERVEGTIAVVVPTGRREEGTAELAEELHDLDRLRVLDGLDTKGLEFDAVVLVEPDEVVAESESGWRTLYVVLTRATQLLLTVGSTRSWLDRVEA